MDFVTTVIATMIMKTCIEIIILLLRDLDWYTDIFPRWKTNFRFCNLLVQCQGRINYHIFSSRSSNIFLFVIFTATPCLYPGVIRGSWLSSFYGPLTIEESQVSNITFKEIGSLSFMCDVTNGTSYVSRYVQHNIYIIFYGWRTN